MVSSSQIAMKLKDGDRIAVIGGGPAGSFFSYYALEMIERFDLNVKIDIYETKDFSKIGAGGCNHCGGVVSESLVQKLSTDGIIVPDEIIQRGLNSYTLHTEDGSSIIQTPGNESRIASVFRGCGPRGCVGSTKIGFDQFLLEISQSKGANLMRKRVSLLERTQEGIWLSTAGGEQRQKYDLIVGACGLNQKTLELFSELCEGYRPPMTTRTYISEVLLETESMNQLFGNSMHVFLLDLPNITFGALVPKEKYVTLVLLGKEIDKEVVNSFIESEVVKKCFAEGEIKISTPCKCYPLLSLKGAKLPFDDRVVLIGDAASSKLYKNGIGAAYLTAKTAASSILFNGYSKKALKDNYGPLCRKLDVDNRIGSFIFFLTRLIQKSSILKKAVLRLINREAKLEGERRRFSRVLWNTFTGSADYKSIFYQLMHPALINNFIKSLIKR